MKTYKDENHLKVRSGDGQRYLNANMALMAMTIIQTAAIMEGYKTTSYANPDTGYFYLTIHLPGGKYPQIPKTYTYTNKVLTAYKQYDNKKHEPYASRTIRYDFLF